MNDVVVAQTFEERMKARIKDSMGDLLSDEDLSKMVARSLEEVFFTKRTVKDGYYNTKDLPPLLHDIVKDSLKEQVYAAINAWINEHQAEVHKTIEDVVKQGIGVAMFSALEMKFSYQFDSFKMNILSSIQKT